MYFVAHYFFIFFIKYLWAIELVFLGFAFANMASAVEFEEQRSMFFRELRRYDDFMEIHEGLDLSDCPVFEEEVIALNTTGKPPWFTNPFYYWLYSCCLLSWPFRLILSYNTVHVNYKVSSRYTYMCKHILK